MIICVTFCSALLNDLLLISKILNAITLLVALNCIAIDDITETS